ncbi:putative leader peptide [Amycolatopsis sp. NBC_01488]|uniref:putative leader peptide n=1 Tax=Amycolatopsis sp. NBC_01488 TaxID=2903563 RepID=UPI003FA4CAC6
MSHVPGIVPRYERGSHSEGALGTLAPVTGLTTFLTQRRAVDLCRVRSSLCRTHADRR